MSIDVRSNTALFSSAKVSFPGIGTKPRLCLSKSNSGIPKEFPVTSQYRQSPTVTEGMPTKIPLGYITAEILGCDELAHSPVSHE
jgi:hypothetical protein